jgi:hypothetical protein
MSVSSEVQRTLVKSPPELWAELSDPTTLARHLGELGEIRILRTEPDRAVDWEAAAADGAQATGRVEIEPSGWGTRVTLSASRVTAEPVSEPESEQELEPIGAVVGPEPQPEPEPIAAVIEPDPDPEIAEPEPEIVEPEPRPGFFARLFRRRRQPEPAVEPAPEPIAEVAVDESEPDELESEPEPIAEVKAIEPAPEPDATAPESDLSAELAELEEQTTAVLTGVLDRLGAAHHRPFSRS